MSPDVLAWLSALLERVTLPPVGADDFEEQALLAIKAKREVAAALAAGIV